MTTEQLLHLRQTADRDDSLTTTARLLFGEIINLNVLGDGCYKAYTTLAEDLGLNERTVRRRRKELESAGYLTVSREGDRRYLVPTPPDTSDRTGQQCPDNSVRPDTSDRTEVSAPDTDDETPPDTSVEDKEVYNPAEAQEAARARGKRWAFLPGYRQRYLPEIKRAAGPHDEPADVMDVATQYLSQAEEQLSGVVDFHREQRPDDEVIAAYVIAGREADSPIEYADKIIREGWKRSGGDGAASSSQLPDPDSDKTVIRFGSTAPTR